MGLRHKSEGITLIEVMVSLVILAIGLLGLAALHGLGAKSGNRAYYRSQAISQAYDLVDRMRANVAGTAASNYVQSPMPSSYSSDCGASSCAASDLALYDLVEWNTTNGALLPGGNGAVSMAGSDVTVVVNWLEDADGDGVAETKSVTLTARI